MKCKSKGIIITGGNHGIGKILCLAYLKEGAKVCMIDKTNTIDPELIKENLYFYNGDISKKETLDDFVEFVHKNLNSVDVLINNACISKKGIISECSYEDFDHVLSVGVKAPYYLSLKLKDSLIKSGGNIINMSSTRAFQSQQDTESYSSAKGALCALTHSLSISLGGKVRVNAIAPGWINTTDDFTPSCDDKKAIPVGRVGSTEDIANLALFLSDESSSFITGETITIDGGMSKQMIYHGDYAWSYNNNKKG